GAGPAPHRRSPVQGARARPARRRATRCAGTGRALHQGGAVTGQEEDPGEDSAQEDSPEEPGASGPEEFDEAAFEAAFAAEFGQTVEPDRQIRDDGAAPADQESSAGEQGASGAEAGWSAQAGPGADAGPGAEAGEGAESGESRRVLAVVLTPIASAQVLAALCSMAKVEADIIPTKRGALAAKVITTSGELDPEELLSGAPAEAKELATTLSGTTKLGVVLLTARLGEDQDGITGTISARSFDKGTEGEEVAPGLILAQSDDVVEQILVGSLDPAEAPGRVVPGEMSRWQAARLMAKQLKRRKP